jgi:hypothetical protein
MSSGTRQIIKEEMIEKYVYLFPHRSSDLTRLYNVNLLKIV